MKRQFGHGENNPTGDHKEKCRKVLTADGTGTAIQSAGAGAMQGHEPTELIYESLEESDAIRLLRLEPAPLQSALIHCEMFRTTLSKCKDDIVDHYSALSYVWGDREDTRTITVNGRELKVTVNLENALRDLREERRSRLLWIDAICINQKDLDERAQQVELMRSIYTAAWHTIIYLGPLDEESDNSMKVLKEWINYRASEPAEIPVPQRALARKPLLDRPWFTRVWVLQELVCSDDPWVQIGSDLRLRWIDFCQILEFSVNCPCPDSDISEQLLPETFPKDIPPPYFRRLEEMNEARKRYLRQVYINGKGTPILDLLIGRRALGVSDPRDMLFAHIGIANEGQDDPELTDPRLTVDYNKTVAQVYEDIALYFLKNPNVGRDILSYIEDVNPDERRRDLPSWVPDWTRTHNLYPRLLTLLTRKGNEDNPPRNAILDEDDPTFVFLNSIHVLACRGHLIGTVKRVTETLSYPKAFFDKSHETFHISDEEEKFKRRNHVYFTVYNDWRKMLGPEILPPLPEGKDWEDSWDIELPRVFRRDNERDNETAQFYNQCQSLASHLVLAADEDTSSTIIDGRRLAELDNEMVVLVPACAKTGDTVCFFENHPIPFVLQPMSPHFCSAQDTMIVEEFGRKGFILEENENSRFNFLSGRYNRHQPLYVRHCKVIGESFVEGYMYGSNKGFSFGDPMIFALH